MWTYYLEYLRQVNLISIFVRLLLAVLFGGIIGIERGSKRRAAGFRTYMLVCMGAALVMITNQYVCDYFKIGDPSRLGAQVISGIGFLGAGTIIVTRSNQVIGLTTAAGLWASACVGLAIGIGFYEGALMASFFVIFIITTLHRLDKMVMMTARSMEVYVEFNEGGKLSAFQSYMHMNAIRVEHVEFTKAKYDDGAQLSVLVTLRLPKKHPHIEVIEQLRNADGVTYIEEL